MLLLFLLLLAVVPVEGAIFLGDVRDPRTTLYHARLTATQGDSGLYGLYDMVVLEGTLTLSPGTHGATGARLVVPVPCPEDEVVLLSDSAWLADRLAAMNSDDCLEERTRLEAAFSLMSLDQLALMNDGERFVLGDDALDALTYDHDRSWAPVWTYLVVDLVDVDGDMGNNGEVAFGPVAYLYPVDEGSPRTVPSRHLVQREGTPLLNADDTLVFAHSGVIGKSPTPEQARAGLDGGALSQDEQRLIDWAYQVDQSTTAASYRALTGHIKAMFKDVGVHFEPPELRVAAAPYKGQVAEDLHDPVDRDLPPDFRGVDKDLVKLLRLERRRVAAQGPSSGDQQSLSVGRLLLAYFAVQDFMTSHFRLGGVDLVAGFPRFYSLQEARWRERVVFFGLDLEEGRMRGLRVDGDPTARAWPLATFHVGDAFMDRLVSAIRDALGQDGYDVQAEGDACALVEVDGSERDGDLSLLLE